MYCLAVESAYEYFVVGFEWFVVANNVLFVRVILMVCAWVCNLDRLKWQPRVPQHLHVPKSPTMAKVIPKSCSPFSG